jgi:fumarate hydratase, class II
MPKAVERDAERVRRGAYGLRRLGIGGTAVGSGLNAHPEYHARMVRKLSELTGLELYESDDLFESMQSMADAADFSASLRTLALTLIRIANDFRLLSSGPSTGLDEIAFPPSNRVPRSCPARSIPFWQRCSTRPCST